MTGHIVVGVDESAGAAEALRWAVQEAELRDTTVLAVLAWSFIDQQPAGQGFDPHYGAADADRALQGLVDATLDPSRAARVHRLAVCDLPARALLDAAAGEEMLVVGARGLGGFKGLLVGSVSRHCVHAAVTPTVVVRNLDHDGTGVVVGVDGSMHSRAALEWAVDEARRRSATLTVVHGYDLPMTSRLAPFGGSERRADAARALLDRAVGDVDTTGLDLRVAADPSGGAAAIVDEASGAELVVVGSRGLGAARRMLVGSVAAQVLHHAPCSVAIIPRTQPLT